MEENKTITIDNEQPIVSEVKAEATTTETTTKQEEATAVKTDPSTVTESATAVKIDPSATTESATAPELDEMALLKRDRKKLEKELQNLKDKQLRLYAEFDNYRRRTTKERLNLIQTASADIVTELLPVLDDFERAFKAASITPEENEGYSLIYNKFLRVLSNKGLKPMSTTGDVFNVDLHEALTEIPAPTDELKGKIVDEVEKGYYLHDKIIRHAKVVIGK